MWNFRQMGTRSSYLCGNTLQTSSPTSQFYNGFDNSAYWRSSHFQMRRRIQSERRWWYWMSLLGFLVLVASQLYWGRLRTTLRNWERQSLLDKPNHKHWQHRRIPLLSRYVRLLLLHPVKASGRRKKQSGDRDPHHLFALTWSSRQKPGSIRHTPRPSMITILKGYALANFGIDEKQFTQFTIEQEKLLCI